MGTPDEGGFRSVIKNFEELIVQDLTLAILDSEGVIGIQKASEKDSGRF